MLLSTEVLITWELAEIKILKGAWAHGEAER